MPILVSPKDMKAILDAFCDTKHIKVTFKDKVLPMEIMPNGSVWTMEKPNRRQVLKTKDNDVDFILVLDELYARLMYAFHCGGQLVRIMGRVYEFSDGVIWDGWYQLITYNQIKVMQAENPETELTVEGQPFTGQKPTCAVCRKPSTSVCPLCGIRLYCGKQCQIKDWRQHKEQCGIVEWDW